MKYAAQNYGDDLQKKEGQKSLKAVILGNGDRDERNKENFLFFKFKFVLLYIYYFAFQRTPPPFIQESFSKHLNACYVPGARYGLSGILFLLAYYLVENKLLRGNFGTGSDEWQRFVDI